MRFPLYLCIFLYSGIGIQAQLPKPPIDTTKAIRELKHLYDIEEQLILHQDTAGMKQFYPDDFVVTNPFNMFINKSTVIKRVQSDIIKYTSYKRTYDAFRFEGNTAIVIGGEIVTPTKDAARSDAGKIVHRRFTEVWVKRGGEWKKIVRHASNITGTN